MTSSYSSIGIRRMWRRKSLVALIYILGLTVAGLVAGAVSRLLAVEIGPSGFSSLLVERFDLMLWIDFWDGIGPGLAGVARQVVLLGLIMMVWKVANSVGLIHALHAEGTGSFWEGLSRFTIRGLGLGLLYFIPLGLILGGVMAGSLELADSMGEVGAFWTLFVALPVAVIVIMAIVDLFHDYGRIHLVLRGTTAWRAWLEGIKWPYGHFRSVLLYKLWFLFSAALWLAVLAVGFYFPDQSIVAVVLAFFVQQILIVGRTGAYVSWIASQVAFFEHLGPPVVESVHDTNQVEALGAGELAGS